MYNKIFRKLDPAKCALFYFFVLGITVFNTLTAEEFIPYRIVIEQAESEKQLLSQLQSTLQQNRDKLTVSGIQMPSPKLIRLEQELLVKVLRSEGYYEAITSYEQLEGNVQYRIVTGRIFHIDTITISSSQPDIKVLNPDQLGLARGMPLQAAKVLDAQDMLDQYLRNANCLWQGGSSYEVRLDRPSATADIVFQVKPSEQVRLGQITFAGLDTVKDTFVRQDLQLQTGQCYQGIAIEKARLRLLQNGLFSMVDSQVSPPVAGTVDLSFEFKERHHRTLKVGAGYSNDESISLSAGWQHRNYFGSAERLDIEGKISALFKVLDFTLTIPAFMDPGQALILEAELADENLEAFDAFGITLTATLRKRLMQNLTASAGIQYQSRSVQESDHDDLHSLISLPATLEYDRRDVLLDPRKGWVATLKMQPFVDLLDTDIIFLKTTLGASIYHTLYGIKYEPTLAARAVVGSIIGNDTDSLPADERFYAGGGGSVRGYPFQKLGPIVKHDPTGGKSLLEISLEARLHFTENWGGVAFIDAGNVYDNPYPELGEGLRWAAGIGARYITTLAPIRLDLAFPINRRRGIDDAFQIYVSLAQAF